MNLTNLSKKIRKVVTSERMTYITSFFLMISVIMNIILFNKYNTIKQREAYISTSEDLLEELFSALDEYDISSEDILPIVTKTIVEYRKGQLVRENVVTIFFELTIEKEKAEALKSELIKLPYVEKCKIMSPKDAADFISEESGAPVEDIDVKKLPYTIDVTTSDKDKLVAYLETVMEKYEIYKFAA